MFEDELLDIVDEHDKVIQTMMRSEAYEKKIFPQIRAVWLMLKTKDGQFWIPRRCTTKKVLPYHLDGSVVGHVRSGETYEQAMIREAEEEIGMQVTSMPFCFLGKLTPKEHNAFCMAAVYELEVDEPFDVNFNKDDFCDAAWMSAEQVMQLVEKGELVKDMLPVVLRHFYGA